MLALEASSHVGGVQLSAFSAARQLPEMLQHRVDQVEQVGPQLASRVVNALARVIDEHGEDASEEARELKRDYRNIARKPRGIVPWAISRTAGER